MTDGPPPDPALPGQVLQTRTDAVVSIDEHGLVTSWNPAATTMFGWRGEGPGRLAR